MGKNPPIGKPILSPLREEKHPSFNIYKDDKSGQYLFNDFGSGQKGDCINFVEIIKDTHFKGAIEILQNEFNCIIDDDDNVNKPLALKKDKSPQENLLKSAETTKSFKISSKRKFDKPEADYFKQYKIKPEIIKKYNVLALDSYTLSSGITINGKENELIFCYNHNDWVKIYKPFEANHKYRFVHLGKKQSDFIFGYNQLPGVADQLIITGGEKDVLTLASLGYNAISLNSETATISTAKATELLTRFKEIVVLYDIDETGLRESEKLCKAFGFKQAFLPSGLYPVNEKDISDFIKNGFSEDQLNDVFTNSVNHIVEKVIEPEKYIYNAVELLELGKTEPEYLMTPLFPRIGTAVIAGKPDTGKSQFARQLCISVSVPECNFLDFKLNPIHNRAIYISTEDSKEATSYLLNKQLSGLNLLPSENLEFIFGDILDQTELLNEVEKTIKESPVDLVVIDCFGDIFTGNDSNNNMAMRNTVKVFSHLASKHSCLVLFVHHINKGAYRQSPGQEHIQGGAGLVQKVRLAIQLTEGEGNTRYLSVVKGNYCPKEYKENSMILDFSEDSFLFTNSGKTILTSGLGIKPEIDNKEEKYTELSNIAEIIFRTNIISYCNFVKQFCEITGKSIATAKRTHNNLKKLELIIECEGGYQLSNPGKDTFTEPDEDEIPF